MIPSETNFFMVGIGRDVQPVIGEFRAKGIMVGRPFPPMTQHMRVSIGTEDDMSEVPGGVQADLPGPHVHRGARLSGCAHAPVTFDEHQRQALVLVVFSGSTAAARR